MDLFVLVFVLLALLLLAAAVWLFAAAGAEARGRSFRARLGDMSHEPADETPVQKTMNLPLLGRLYKLLWRSGFEPMPAQLLRGCVAAVLIAILLLVVLGLLRGAVVLAVLVAAGLFFLSWRAARRRLQIVDQLPAFLENVVRILTAGNTLDEAFATAGRENPDPVRGVIQAVSRQARLGVPLEQALDDAGAIYRLRDLKVIGLAVAVNRRYGGSIRNVFRSLVKVIRQRNASTQELRALTAETRFSAVVLAVVSFGLFAYIYLNNPDYYAQMLSNPTGRILLFATFGLMVAGALIIWRMTNLMGDPDE